MSEPRYICDPFYANGVCAISDEGGQWMRIGLICNLLNIGAEAQEKLARTDWRKCPKCGNEWPFPCETSYMTCYQCRTTERLAEAEKERDNWRSAYNELKTERDELEIEVKTHRDKAKGDVLGLAGQCRRSLGVAIVSDHYSRRTNAATACRDSAAQGGTRINETIQGRRAAQAAVDGKRPNRVRATSEVHPPHGQDGVHYRSHPRSRHSRSAS